MLVSTASSSASAAARPTAVHDLGNGVTTTFPYEPYPCQLDFMRAVVSSLDSKRVGLLESPTGTGKTLCLLCAATAWQAARRADGTLPPGGAQIVYASRTHSQLSQVAKEMKKAGVAATCATLGSREQLCVHERVSQLRGARQNAACSTLVGARACGYRNKLTQTPALADTAAPPVADIEEVAKAGRAAGICPYYASRDRSATADVVLAPYVCVALRRCCDCSTPPHAPLRPRQIPLRPAVPQDHARRVGGRRGHLR